MNKATNPHDGARDFDFLMGRWDIQNRRLVKRLAGSTEWEEFATASAAKPILGGAGNMDENTAELWRPGWIGMSLRFYNPQTHEWSIYWVDNRTGVLQPLQPPVVGSFSGDVGIFEGPDEFDGKPIVVRYTWSRATTNTPRWEQAFSLDQGKTWETNWVMDFSRAAPAVASEDQPGVSKSIEQIKHLNNFPVIELRRYTVEETERNHFAQYFESYFPEAFEQLGSLIFGQFLERGNKSGFTWIRGFHNIDERAAVNQAFYYGPLWKEHGPTMNARLIDHTNVLLLRPLSLDRGVSVLPAVDSIREINGAQGIVVAQIFPVNAASIDAFAQQAEATFAAYRAAGVREAGVLVTLDVPNNFAPLPFRTDGPYLVWLGIIKDEALLEQFKAGAERSMQSLSASGLLRDVAELVVLDPARRSRLRWLADR